MQRRHLAVTLLAAAAPLARPHAILLEPVSRPNMDVPPGEKLPFAGIKPLADSGCGGTANNDPGVQRPIEVYRPGERHRAASRPLSATCGVLMGRSLPLPECRVDRRRRVAVDARSPR
jgi:hypothetical protein